MPTLALEVANDETSAGILPKTGTLFEHQECMLTEAEPPPGAEVLLSSLRPDRSVAGSRGHRRRLCSLFAINQRSFYLAFPVLYKRCHDSEQKANMRGILNLPCEAPFRLSRGLGWVWRPFYGNRSSQWNGGLPERCRFQAKSTPACRSTECHWAVSMKCAAAGSPTVLRLRPSCRRVFRPHVWCALLPIPVFIRWDCSRMASRQNDGFMSPRKIREIWHGPYWKLYAAPK